MAYTKTTRVTPTSEKPNAIVGRDRLSWRHADGRLFLFHRNSRNPLVTVEPDSKYVGMYRLRLPDGRLTDMVNLTRAKDAAVALALRSLNSGVQESPLDGPHVRAKRSVVVNTRRTEKRPHEPRTGFLAEDRS